jgi:hypothetical protein
LRASKVLIVGDDKQVSPTAAFIEEQKLRSLRMHYLDGQPFGALMLPGNSLYELALACYPGRRIMLKEHFRCVEPIIRFSFQFYTEEIVPVRLPNGRTYDHLRERLPGRDIFVFDRQMAAHPDCIPPIGHLFLGEVIETLPSAIARLGANTALANVDIGSSDDWATEELVRRIVPSLLRLLKHHAVVICGRPIDHPCFAALPLPYAVEPGRHFLYARISEDALTPLARIDHANENHQEGRRYILASER